MDRYVVETAASANAFARIRHESDGTELKAELVGATAADGTPTSLKVGDVITGVADRGWVRRPRVVEPVPPPADLVAAQQTVLDALARAGFHVGLGDALAIATKVFRVGRDARQELALIARTALPFYGFLPGDDLAETVRWICDDTREAGAEIVVDCVANDAGQLHQFHLHGAKGTQRVAIPRIEEEPHLSLRPVIEHANAALESAAAPSRWFLDGSLWILVEPARWQALVELGLVSRD